MNVRIYTDGYEFYQQFKDVMLMKEAVFQLMITNCKNIIDGKIEEFLLGTVEEDGKVILLFQEVKPYSLLIHDLLPVNKKAISTLVDYLKEHHLHIHGINTKKEIAELFLEVATIEDYHIRLESDIMELRSLTGNYQQGPGELVRAKNDDLDFALACYKEFYEDCFNEKADIESYRFKMKDYLQQGHLYFYKVEDKIVSTVLVSRQLIHGVALSLVYTLPQHRNQKYATYMMYEMSKQLLEMGHQFCCLFVDRHNPVSNKVYQRIGYKYLEDKCEVVFKF